MLGFLLFELRQLIKERGVTEPDRETYWAVLRSLLTPPPPSACCTASDAFRTYCITSLISLFIFEHMVLNSVVHNSSFGFSLWGYGGAISSSHLCRVCLLGSFRAVAEEGFFFLTFIFSLVKELPAFDILVL